MTSCVCVAARKPYKSPFERKRENEIRSMDRKLSRGHVMMQEQQRDIESLERDIRLQKLALLQQEVR